MKTKLIICAVLLFGVAGTVGASYLQQQNDTLKVAERAET
ncbi:hypothetical protein NRS6108_04136 [Bacillus subtilis]|jgi:hypothetical protein|nr:hypothetical protein NRS6108_04136 [Bacillus subtilis]